MIEHLAPDLVEYLYDYLDVFDSARFAATCRVAHDARKTYIRSSVARYRRWEATEPSLRTAWYEWLQQEPHCVTYTYATQIRDHIFEATKKYMRRIRCRSCGCSIYHRLRSIHRRMSDKTFFAFSSIEEVVTRQAWHDLPSLRWIARMTALNAFEFHTHDERCFRIRPNPRKLVFES